MISGIYKELYDRLTPVISEKRMFHDALSTLAYGTDASFYRLIPKLVIRAADENEVRHILQEASKLGIAVTFRAAGTSLSGQAVSDSVLVIASHNWTDWKITEGGEKITLGPGIRGARANGYLARYGRKIGPDPASIDSAMIGGIAANNASGMCCGTSQNSYKTIADIRVILADGTLLDTGDKESVAAFKESHGSLLKSLEQMSERINGDEELCARIRRKYKIKNTTGYSLNAFVDYREGIEILKHLIIGSEGTLAFIAGVTYNTVIEHKDKALALAVFNTIAEACEAVQILQSQPVTAVEMLDRAAIRSVDKAPGIPEFLKSLGDECCALLIETKAASDKELDENIELISKSIAAIPTVEPYSFTKNPKEQAILWKVRKETLPTVAGMRKSGTTSIIEDICFPVPKLAEATMELRKVFARNGYDDAVIFGHALAGNLHFMFNQDFGTPSEVLRYSKFMDDVANMVVGGYDGSLKAEHGTGRNMAPFVELEWGKQAYGMMKEVKMLFDPQGILNPGVIINDNPEAHISNLKPCPSTRPLIDKCMECGFCEGWCTTEGLTLSPRQRVAAFREMERLRKSGEDPARAAEMQKLYKYAGVGSCATDSLCNLHCPVGADAGKLVKELRHESHSPKQEKRAVRLYDNMAGVTAFARGGLKVVNGMRSIVGKEVFGAMARGMRSISGGLIPLWNEYMPTGAHKLDTGRQFETKKEKVVYFPSCITRSMGTTKAYCKEKELTAITEALLLKAGYQIIYPKNLHGLCCGMAFSSKGFVEAGKKASDELEAALWEASEGGKYPILCDMSPCLYTMRVNMGDRLKLHEPAEFIEKYIIERLEIEPVDRNVALFAVCSAKKLGVDATLASIARRCAKNVVVIDSNCCGFAGDHGFTLPELNTYGLRMIKGQIEGCDGGYATSRTCEIGLSRASGIVFKSIIYLVAEAAGISLAKKD